MSIERERWRVRWVYFLVEVRERYNTECVERLMSLRAVRIQRHRTRDPLTPAALLEHAGYRRIPTGRIRLVAPLDTWHIQSSAILLPRMRGG